MVREEKEGERRIGTETVGTRHMIFSCSESMNSDMCGGNQNKTISSLILLHHIASADRNSKAQSFSSLFPYY